MDGGKLSEGGPETWPVSW